MKKIKYSRIFARDYGIKEAIICQYLAFRIRRAFPHQVGAWYAITALEISKAFANIFPQSTVNAILNGLVLRGVLNKKRAGRFHKDSTLAFQFTSEPLLTGALSEGDHTSIWLRYDEVLNYGLIEAVLIQNIAYLSILNAQSYEKYEYVNTSSAKLAAFTGVTPDQAERALARLYKSKMLQRKATNKDKASYGYKLVDPAFVNVRLEEINPAKKETPAVVVEKTEIQDAQIASRKAPIAVKEAKILSTFSVAAISALSEILIDYKNCSTYQSKKETALARQARISKIEEEQEFFKRAEQFEQPINWSARDNQ